MFLCANDKLVITQKPLAILKIFHACFPYLAVILQVTNYKINSRKISAMLHRYCAITWYLYINKRILMRETITEKEIMKAM